MRIEQRALSLFRVAPWTLGLSVAIVVLNLGVVAGAPVFAGELLDGLEFDREAILAGQAWRLLTGNLVHWSWQHLALAVGAFLAVGLLFERGLGRLYPWVLLTAAVAVGAGLLLFAPEVSLYRGLSGVDSGQFAVAVLHEIRLVRAGRQLLLPVGAALVFGVKMLYECLTGTMMFGTESLGDIGIPLPVAHVAGTLGALVALGTRGDFRFLLLWPVLQCRRNEG